MRVRRYSVGIVCLLLAGVAEADCPQLLLNNEFSDPTISPWALGYGYASVDYGVSSDAYKALLVDVDAYYYPDTDPDYHPTITDAWLEQQFTVQAGERYRLTFWARADHDGVPIDAEVVSNLDDSVLAHRDYDLVYNTGSGDNYTLEFTASASESVTLYIDFGLQDASLAFDSLFLSQTSSPACPPVGVGGNNSGGAAGGPGVGGTVGSGGASSGSSVVTGGSGGTSAAAITGAVIRANQVGYLPNAEKIATVKHPSTTALDWQLLDASNAVLASGVTRSIANDPISGDSVHLVDFSSHTAVGTGLRLRVGDSTSHAFRIGGDSYGALRRDALRFYYHQRASTAIAQPYAEGSQWVRAAGHLDTNLSCRSDAGCKARRNVKKGWYDAGDFGKYVVNGGISAWTLMHLYERTGQLGTTLSKLGDGTSNIPESGNGVPDLLDEVRWEMEFLLAMQVPAGETLAGMAHHKLHGTTWPAIPCEPSADATTRLVSAPSTAATLNLAATAAQCARVFAEVDTTFATRCRNAATSAFAAAQAHPAIYAVSSAATATNTDDDGGGAYEDSQVSDEFYWAAAELYATTGEAQYLQSLLASTHHKQITTASAPFNWQATAGLGALTLATTTANVDAGVVSDVRHAVVDAASSFHGTAATAYGTSMKSYYWGSNADVLNAAMVLALAYDLTGDTKYRGSALGALDYLLGRNPLGQSYVTGYGALPFENVHHRFFAHGFDITSPAAPPGFVAGGPNTTLDGLKPVGTLSGCQGPKCWIDNAAAFGLTEVTINWNAPLTWMTAWASEQETSPKATFPGFVGGVPQSNGGAGAGGASVGGAPSTLVNLGGTGNVQGTTPATTAANPSTGGTPNTTLPATSGQLGGGATGLAIGTTTSGIVASTTEPIHSSSPHGGASGSFGRNGSAAGAGASDATGQDPECDCRLVGAPSSPNRWLAFAALGLLLRRKGRR